MQSQKTKKVVEIANFTATAIALAAVSRFILPRFELGGGFTILCCLPVLLVAQRHGMVWGLISGLLLGIARMALDIDLVQASFGNNYFGSGIHTWRAWLSLVLDYLAACGVLCLGGLFRKRIHPRRKAFTLSCLVAMLAQYLIHLISGMTAFSSLANWYFCRSSSAPTWGPELAQSVSGGVLTFLFSLFYNSLYMLPEIVLTVIAAYAIGSNRRLLGKQK